MLRVPAAEVLRRSDVLRRSEFHEEVIVLWPKEWSFTVHGRLADDARLVNVVVLKRVVTNAVDEFISVVMTLGTTSSALRDAGRKYLFTTRDLLRFDLIRKLVQRIGK